MDGITIREVGSRRCRHQKQREQRLGRPAVQDDPEQDRVQARNRKAHAGEQAPTARLVQDARVPDARPECPVRGRDEEQARDGDEAFHADGRPESGKPSIRARTQQRPHCRRKFEGG